MLYDTLPDSVQKGRNDQTYGSQNAALDQLFMESLALFRPLDDLYNLTEREPCSILDDVHEMIYLQQDPGLFLVREAPHFIHRSGRARSFVIQSMLE